MDQCRSIIFQYIISIIYYTLINILTIVYSLIFLLKLLYLFIKNPTKQFWKVKRRELPPKCLNDPAYGNHKYIQIKNVKLHYVEAGDKEKPLIIMIHGFPDFWYTWRHQLKEFSKDFLTIAIDLRGYGDSEKPCGKKYYKSKYITEDIKNFVETLGKEKCILIGHDWGGLYVWKFAQLYPEKLEKYIILNAPEQKVFWKYITKSFDQFMRSWYIFFFQAPYLPELALRLNDLQALEDLHKTKNGVSFVTEEDTEVYKFTFGKPGALTPPLNYYRAALINKTSLSENVKLLSQPINKPGLVIISNNDVALTRGLLETCAKIAGGENVKIVILDGTHFIQQEKPDQVNLAISNFIRDNK